MPAPNPLVQLMQSQPNIDFNAPVEARAVFDPPVVRPGEPATYRVTFNAMQAAVRWPEEMFGATELNLRSTASGQVFKPGGTGLVPQTTYNYRAVATKAGRFTVPRFLVYVNGQPVTVPTAELEVSPSAPAARASALMLVASSTNVYVGETVNVRLQLLGTEDGVLQTLTGVQLNGDGFVAEGSSVRQQVTTVRHAGKDVPGFIYDTAMTWLRPGRQELTAQGHTAGLQFAGPISITGRVTLPGGAGQFTLLDSEPLAFQVRPLPRDGELPGFTGAIGQFQLDAPVLSTNQIRAGDVLTLSVNLRGAGNLVRVVPPPPPRLADWQVFAVTTDTTPPQLTVVRGFKTFRFTLIANRDGVRETPMIPFSYFNSAQGEYVALNIPPVPVTVSGGVAVAPPLGLAEPDTVAAPRLTGLAKTPGATVGSLTPHQSQAWFPVVQVLPLLGLLGLGWWDRHRRYHEARPWIRIRRQACKQLRREWAAALRMAALGDTGRFARHAVGAFRAACAPHFPAQPEAIVGKDVLAVLPEPLSCGVEGDAVRKLFSAVDAERFAVAAPEARDLLALRPELERALTRLEAQLSE